MLNLNEKLAGPAPQSSSFALFALGFRPFYLLASAFAALAIPLWILVLSGVVALPMPGVLWHAHEMIFGFAVAVIVGFLFTAGRNWTGLPTPTGGQLAALAGLWLLGRIGIAFSGGALAALIDVAFLPTAAIALALVLIKAESRRNYFIIVLLSVLALANIAFHLARFDALALDPLRPLWFALSLITVLETVIGGRVIPMFTASALRGVKQWQNRRFELATIAMTAIALLLWVLDLALIGAPVAAVAAALQFARCIGWNPWAARRTPLLWILHIAHLWIPVGLTLLALVQWGVLPPSAGVHALAIGATGGLIIGMITRTALGHTGRMLVAGKVEVTAYVLVQLAAVSRVLTVIAFPSLALSGIHLAATLWALAFGLYFIRYLPWLIRSRPDGRPG
jgi:uncharacterized protein involved in response to NO